MFALKSNGEIIEVYGTLEEAEAKLEYMKRVVDKAYVKMFGYTPIYREIEEMSCGACPFRAVCDEYELYWGCLVWEYSKSEDL